MKENEKEFWNLVGSIFDNREGCLSCPYYKKFDIYTEHSPVATRSNYCIILADWAAKPEQCPELEKKK